MCDALRKLRVLREAGRVCLPRRSSCSEYAVRQQGHGIVYAFEDVPFLRLHGSAWRVTWNHPELACPPASNQEDSHSAPRRGGGSPSRRRRLRSGAWKTCSGRRGISPSPSPKCRSTWQRRWLSAGAETFHKRRSFRGLQILWADEKGRFPMDGDCSEGVRSRSARPRRDGTRRAAARMFIRDLAAREEFVAGDNTILREPLQSPERRPSICGTRLAHAIVRPGEITRRHRLRNVRGLLRHLRVRGSCTSATSRAPVRAGHCRLHSAPLRPAASGTQARAGPHIPLHRRSGLEVSRMRKARRR
ncbi:MAG: hypothetical protein M0C28_05140 [Candidatus Moduliflexus flocculans]|nr:hypothetical protein [Candidatus Moduliflexus flocculans]